MGYAKLNFPAATTTAQALFDVVRILNGTITSTASLSYAVAANSEIVNTRGENWTVAYGTPSATATAYILSTPCVTGTKTHFARLQIFSGVSWDTSNAFSANTQAGIMVNTISSASSTTSVVNPTYYSTTTGTAAGAAGRYVVKVDTTDTCIYIHWSRYHILFYGKAGGSATRVALLGTFEYPENNLTQFTNTAPILQFNTYYGASSAYLATTVPGLGTETSIVLQGLNIFDPTLNLTSGVYNLGVSGFGTFDLDEFDAVATLNSSGVSAYPLVPFYHSVPDRGIPIMNISQYSGVYKVAKNIGTPETLITVGADDYVFLPMSTTITGGTQEAGIALLKS